MIVCTVIYIVRKTNKEREMETFLDEDGTVSDVIDMEMGGSEEKLEKVAEIRCGRV